ncbi:hypothetical protein HCA89_10985 [Listeria innocua]|uniref:Uncharacterized protein n=1 Tax=Listeria innocua TaxID=1642 RepID=A0AB73HD89_LISIO|nr:hypothetical protein [Listeria innocua]MBC2142837.1 hypothetical protein [Listeria innocua]
MNKYREKYLELRVNILENKMSLPFIISFKSIVFGIYLLFHPKYLETKGAYVYVVSYFDDTAISICFIIFSLTYAMSTLFGKKKVKRASGIAIQTMWAFFFFSFFVREFSGYPNAGWVLILGTLMLIQFELRTGDYT